MGTNQYSYAYDPIGNRLAASQPTSDNGPQTTHLYTANPLNQYLSVTSASSVVNLSYDLDGNLTNDGVYAYTWDAENRLTQVLPLDPDTTKRVTQFFYDYRSRRIGWRLRSKHFTILDGKYFVFDGWNNIAEYEWPNRMPRIGSIGETNVFYTWGLDLSGTLQGAGGIGGLLAVTAGGTTSVSSVLFPLCDANGNITDAVDPDGNLAAHFEYDPYGNTIATDGAETQTIPFRFSSKYNDEETGLYYYGYRFYNPTLGRWMSMDPLHDESFVSRYFQNKSRCAQRLLRREALNPLYRFLANCPLMQYDSLGLTIEDPVNPEDCWTPPDKFYCDALTGLAKWCCIKGLEAAFKDPAKREAKLVVVAHACRICCGTHFLWAAGSGLHISHMRTEDTSLRSSIPIRVSGGKRVGGWWAVGCGIGPRAPAQAAPAFPRRRLREKSVTSCATAPLTLRPPAQETELFLCVRSAKRLTRRGASPRAGTPPRRRIKTSSASCARPGARPALSALRLTTPCAFAPSRGRRVGRAYAGSRSSHGFRPFVDRATRVAVSPPEDCAAGLRYAPPKPAAPRTARQPSRRSSQSLSPSRRVRTRPKRSETLAAGIAPVFAKPQPGTLPAGRSLMRSPPRGRGGVRVHASLSKPEGKWGLGKRSFAGCRPETCSASAVSAAIPCRSRWACAAGAAGSSVGGRHRRRRGSWRRTFSPTRRLFGQGPRRKGPCDAASRRP